MVTKLDGTIARIDGASIWVDTGGDVLKQIDHVNPATIKTMQPLMRSGALVRFAVNESGTLEWWVSQTGRKQGREAVSHRGHK